MIVKESRLFFTLPRCLQTVLLFFVGYMLCSMLSRIICGHCSVPRSDCSDKKVQVIKNKIQQRTSTTKKRES